MLRASFPVLPRREGGALLWLVFFALLTLAAAQPVDDFDLATLVAELRPAIERATGRTFVEVPEVVWSSTAEMKEASSYELSWLLSNVLVLDAAVVDESMERFEAEVAVLPGLPTVTYLSSVRRVLVNREFVNAQNEGITDRYGPADAAVLRGAVGCLVAHELTHALREQWVNTAAFGSDRGDGARLQESGFAALYGQRACAAAFGSGAARLGELWMGVFAPASQPRTSVLDKYAIGRLYMASLERERGRDAVWAQLAEPAPSANEIVTRAEELMGANWADSHVIDAGRRVLRRYPIKVSKPEVGGPFVGQPPTPISAHSLAAEVRLAAAEFAAGGTESAGVMLRAFDGDRALAESYRKVIDGWGSAPTAAATAKGKSAERIKRISPFLLSGLADEAYVLSMPGAGLLVGAFREGFSLTFSTSIADFPERLAVAVVEAMLKALPDHSAAAAMWVALDRPGVLPPVSAEIRPGWRWLRYGALIAIDEEDWARCLEDGKAAWLAGPPDEQKSMVVDEVLYCAAQGASLDERMATVQFLGADVPYFGRTALAHELLVARRFVEAREMLDSGEAIADDEKQERADLILAIHRESGQPKRIATDPAIHQASESAVLLALQALAASRQTTDVIRLGKLVCPTMVDAQTRRDCGYLLEKSMGGAAKP